MFIRRHIGIIATALAMAGFTSCAIHEDRSECPSWLNLILEECKGYKSLYLSAWNERTLFCDEVSLEQHPHVYEREVEKGLTIVCAFRGIDKSERDEYRIVIPLGEQADSLFVHRSVLDCKDEFTLDTVRLKKHWTTVKVQVKVSEASVKSSPEEDDYRFVVKADICGTDMLTNEPVYGQFEFEPEKDDEGFFVFRLPRQEGDAEELVMDIYKNEVLVDEMQLGKHFAAADYNWEVQNLPDVDMTLHLQTLNVAISVKPWEDLGKDNIIF